MDRARLFPDVEDAWILHEDADLLVIDKPEGISSIAADAAWADDLVSRLHAYVRRTRGEDAYLGIHQRLDRETSGVLLFARRREANRALAAQFEGHRVRKRYVAGVVGWPADRARATLRDRLLPGDAGRMQVAPSASHAQLAVTHVRLLGCVGERALVGLELETGRTHQARVQLAHAGAPVAGDRLYGGACAPRMMLHAHTLSLAHPATGAPVHFEAPVPGEFDAWLARGDVGAAVYDDERGIDRMLRRAARRRYALGHAAEADRPTDAFRLVNEAGDGLPELAVDVYGEHFVAQLYGEAGAFGDRARRERLLDRLDALGPRGIYLKVRPKQANVIVDSHAEAYAPRAPVRGLASGEPLMVHEEGVAFEVRLGDGLSTGLFLDQRANRRRVRELSAGQYVVNLFAYTCAFSVVAALGGAWRTVSVDISAAALDRGRKTMERLGLLDAADHLFVADDVSAWLRRTRSKADRPDLIVLDPPSYSSTKLARFSSSSDYAELAAQALAILRPGGRLLACTNNRSIPRAKFRRFLRDAGRLCDRDIAHVKDLPDPVDFPPPIGCECHLKSALVTLAR